MRDRKLLSRLEEYVAGDLGAAEVTVLEARLAADPAARSLHDEVRAAHEALVSLRDRPQPPVAADEALAHIQRAIASNVFAGKPRLELQSSATRFYRRLAVALGTAAVLLCGMSLGLVIHSQFVAPDAGDGTGTPHATPASTPSNADREFFVITDGVSALDWLDQSGGNLVTLTPTDSIIPIFSETSGR